MRKLLMVGLGVMLLMPMGAQARRHKNQATPTPTPAPAASPAKETDKHSLTLDATLLSSFETKNSDGDPARDDIVLVENLTATGPGSVTLSYQSFYFKDPRTGNMYQADTTNSNDYNKDEQSLSPSDGPADTFKVYFTVPGALRPNKIYVKVGDTMEAYPLSH
ncbi:MAG TPA: hypothetical protein VGO93_30875 [Candidatus Xenobia bacterium]|jgi:hypothetical protein